MSVFHGSRFFCCHCIKFCMMDNTVKLRYARAGLLVFLVVAVLHVGK